MKIIQITQVLKDNNQDYFSGQSADSFFVTENLPKAFNTGEKMFVGKFDEQPESFLKSVGWYDLVVPDGYDSLLHKLGDYRFENEFERYTYILIDLSQQEKDDKLDNKDENEAKEKIERYVKDGKLMIDRVRRKMWRRVHLFRGGLNGLSRVQVGKLDRWFTDAYIQLSFGNFRQAKNETAKVLVDRAADLLETQGMLDTAEWFNTQVLDYFTNNYDM